jgi:hypothetical protein
MQFQQFLFLWTRCVLSFACELFLLLYIYIYIPPSTESTASFLTFPDFLYSKQVLSAKKLPCTSCHYFLIFWSFGFIDFDIFSVDNWIPLKPVPGGVRDELFFHLSVPIKPILRFSSICFRFISPFQISYIEHCISIEVSVVS